MSNLRDFKSNLQTNKAIKTMGQRGDTLVEVLICILIVSLILTGAYVTTTKSTQGVRNSQEHAEALKLVQSQLEQIRQDASRGTASTVFTTAPIPFCMVSGVALSTTIPPDAAKCVQDSAAQPATNQPAYRIVANRAPCVGLPANCRLFTVTATWDSVTGSGNATEQIVYRLYR